MYYCFLPQFPPGGHLMQFLSCLEAALGPAGAALEPTMASASASASASKDRREAAGEQEEKGIIPLFRRRKSNAPPIPPPEVNRFLIFSHI